MNCHVQFIFCVVNQLEFCMASGLTQPSFNITNQHNSVGADIIRPRSLHNFIDSHLVGCGDLDAPMSRQRHEFF